MAKNFLANPANSNDPYHWEIFKREIDGNFNPETNPGSDAQFFGGNQRATAIIAIDFDNLSSITYQVIYFISSAKHFFPGPTFTKKPTDRPEKVDLLSLPWAIILTQASGMGEATFYVGITDRRNGGN